MKQVLHISVGTGILVNKTGHQYTPQGKVSSKACFTKAWKRQNDKSEIAGLFTQWNEL